MIVLAALAQQAATGAPTGFDTPALVQNPGTQSSSNGIAEPASDTFALDQKIFEAVENPVSNGLGPVFNATSCAGCHQNPVTGGPSQITEIRIGHKDDNSNFVNPAIPINDGANTISGRSLAIAQNQPQQSGGLIQGQAIQVPILEAPGMTRVGRFGWKDQHGSLLSFAADAYQNEMGVTSRLRRLRPADSTSLCKYFLVPGAGIEPALSLRRKGF
ncbi:Thiol oxidoreductase-like protein (fragment) [Candidatus Sulfopaludibacter sp. SbA6]